MDRPLMPDLHPTLSPEGAGGLVAVQGPLDIASLAATSNEYGARFVELTGPTTGDELLEQLVTNLGGPAAARRDWDVLEELLAHPEVGLAGPIIIAWRDPGRLAAGDAAVFRAIIRAAADARSRAGEGALVVVAGPDGVEEQEQAAEADESTRIAALPPQVAELGRIHHVAVIVASIETALGVWRDALHLPLEAVLDIEHDRVRIAFLTAGESKIELVEPTDDSTGVARFLASKGEGFHHVCFEVADLAETLTRLALDGLELIDPAPRRGAEGPVAFIHPRSCHGVLVELIEAPGGPAWASLGYPPGHDGGQR